jgi:glycosyltransferase involved in cell wall biosynthesis
MIKYPCVTVILNTCGKTPARTINRALHSILAQDYTDFEVIVVNDGPVDEVVVAQMGAHAEMFYDRDVNFNFFALEEASGYQCVPKNHATYFATGDYIAYLDDDNEWTCDHLTTLMTSFTTVSVDGHPPDLVYGRRLYVKDKECTQDVVEGESPFVPMSPAAQTALSEAKTNFIDTSDFIVSRGALWRLQMVTDRMWDERLRRFADWQLVCRGHFFADWRLHGVDAVVQHYHWTGDNLQLTRPAVETPQAQRA